MQEYAFTPWQTTSYDHVAQNKNPIMERNTMSEFHFVKQKSSSKRNSRNKGIKESRKYLSRSIKNEASSGKDLGQKNKNHNSLSLINSDCQQYQNLRQILNVQKNSPNPSEENQVTHQKKKFSSEAVSYVTLVNDFRYPKSTSQMSKTPNKHELLMQNIIDKSKAKGKIRREDISSKSKSIDCRVYDTTKTINVKQKQKDSSVNNVNVVYKADRQPHQLRASSLYSQLQRILNFKIDNRHSKSNERSQQSKDKANQVFFIPKKVKHHYSAKMCSTPANQVSQLKQNLKLSHSMTKPKKKYASSFPSRKKIEIPPTQPNPTINKKLRPKEAVSIFQKTCFGKTLYKHYKSGVSMNLPKIQFLTVQGSQQKAK